MLAAESGHAEAVADILAHPERRGDPRDLDNQQHDALAHAAWSGNAECVTLLLHVCDTEARWATPLKANGEPGRRKRRANPLQIAAEQGHAECVKILAPVSDLDHKTIRGQRAFDIGLKKRDRNPEGLDALGPGWPRRM